MISKSNAHKLLEIKLLQNALHGRLAVDGTLALDAAHGFESHLAASRPVEAFQEFVSLFFQRHFLLTAPFGNLTDKRKSGTLMHPLGGLTSRLRSPLN